MYMVQYYIHTYFIYACLLINPKNNISHLHRRDPKKPQNSIAKSNYTKKSMNCMNISA